MSKIALEGNASGTGTFTIAGPNTNTNYTITLPQETGTLVTTGVTTGLNGSAITTGTVAASVGGTGITSVGTSGNVLTSNGTAWVSQAAAAGGGDYVMQVFTSPGTWTKPASIKAIKVTVIGGGGGCDGPVPQVGDGGTSSFGAFLSATGGGGASNINSIGTGSGGQLNVNGEKGILDPAIGVKQGGGSAFGFATAKTSGAGNGPDGSACGNGGGGSIEYLDAPALPGPVSVTVGPGGASPGGKPGAAGVVIVEEFY